MNGLSIVRSVSVFIFAVMYLSGCQKISSDGTSKLSKSLSRVSDKPALLATIPADDKSSIYDLQISFSSRGNGVAYTVRKDGRIAVVHNNKPGEYHEGIGSFAISPDGSRIAYTAKSGDKWHIISDGKTSSPFDLIEGPQFSPDGKHVAFQVMKDEIWQLLVDENLSAGANKRFREWEFCNDSVHIMYIDNVDEKRKGRLVLNDITFKNERILDNFVTNVVLNSDRTAVASVSSNSAEREKVTWINFAKPDFLKSSAEYDKMLNVAFTPTGSGLFYFVQRQGKTYGVFNGQEELLPEGVKPGTTVINQAGKSVGVLMSANNKTFLYEMFRNGGKVGKKYDEVEWLGYSSDGSVSLFAARNGKRWCVVTNGKDGPAFDRVVSPKFSPDGKKIVYRVRDKGERFVVVADLEGNILREHSHYDGVWDVSFAPDGSFVGYGVKKGNELWWKVEKL